MAKNRRGGILDGNSNNNKTMYLVETTGLVYVLHSSALNLSLDLQILYAGARSQEPGASHYILLSKSYHVKS